MRKEIGVRLNRAAHQLCEELVAETERYRAVVSDSDCGTRLIDCGVDARGGLECGRKFAEICMAGLGRVEFVPAPREVWSGPAVMVATDHPVAACMAAQYAGWEVAGKDFFAMGSGPMRAAYAGEELFQKIGFTEQPEVAVGGLESGKPPPADVCRQLAEKCGVRPEALTLLVAPTSSQAGTVQVVARSVETAMHKLGELEFDLSQVESGIGVAPLPPVAASDLAGIGRTNDAILYGGEVTLYVHGDDAHLRQLGPKIPSSAAPDFGQPFLAIFERYERDFYKIDPMLFSPAVVTLANLTSGNSFRFGHTLPRVIHESFGVS